MDDNATRIEALYRRGSDELVSDSSLRDALNDEQAQQLLDWGLRQVRESAENAADLPAVEAEAAMASTVLSVRRVMQQTNRLIEQTSQDNGDMYVAVLELVEALQVLDPYTLQLQDLMSLEELAVNRTGLEAQAMFSKIMSLLRREEEE